MLPLPAYSWHSVNDYECQKRPKLTSNYSFLQFLRRVYEYVLPMVVVVKEMYGLIMPQSSLRVESQTKHRHSLQHAQTLGMKQQDQKNYLGKVFSRWSLFSGESQFLPQE